jgi:hypothetical protein
MKAGGSMEITTGSTLGSPIDQMIRLSKAVEDWKAQALANQQKAEALEMLVIRCLEDFESLERSYGQSLWSTGAGYVLRPRYLEMKYVRLRDRAAVKKAIKSAREGK